MGFLVCNSCVVGNSKENINNTVSELDRVVSGNVMFYKAGVGLVFKRAYIRRDDDRNNLYVNNGWVLFCGSDKDDLEIVKVSQKEGRYIAEKINSIPATKEGCIIVYTPQYVYVLDYGENKFGKYFRGLDNWLNYLKSPPPGRGRL